MKLSSFVLLILSAGILVSCSDVKKEIGLGRNSPDEFSVVTRAPLSMPPEYDLTPPKTAEAADKTSPAAEEAKTLIFKTEVPTAAPAGESSAEAALLQQAGATVADDNIRLAIDREAGQVDVKDPYLGRRLMFWKNGEVEEKGEAVDPAEEVKRLKALKAEVTGKK